jgi:protein-disulfide isomerase
VSKGADLSKKLLGFAFLAFALAGPPAAAQAPSVEDAMADRVMGRPDAPVTIIEYSSLTCSHCKSFHKDTLPLIKKTYIDTGKARFIYRDYPLGGLAQAAALMARCAPSKRYFGFIDLLFRNQESWSKSNNPRAELARIALFGGMGEKDFDACLNNQPLMDAIRLRAKADGKTHGIDSTPTFIIEGKKITGAYPFDHFKKIIDDALSR